MILCSHTGILQVYHFYTTSDWCSCFALLQFLYDETEKQVTLPFLAGTSFQRAKGLPSFLRLSLSLPSAVSLSGFSVLFALSVFVRFSFSLPLEGQLCQRETSSPTLQIPYPGTQCQLRSLAVSCLPLAATRHIVNLLLSNHRPFAFHHLLPTCGRRAIVDLF